jgi:O-antigen ligase
MNKTIANTVFLLFVLWSILTLQQAVEMYSGEQNLGTLGYATIFLLLSIESLSILVILLNIWKLLTSRLNLIVFLWMIYIVFNALINSNNLFLDLRETLWWPLTYFLFYFISYNDNKNQYIHLIIRYFPIFFIAITLQYASIRLASLNFGSLIAQAMMSVNHVFFVALLLPFAFLIKKKSLKYLILFIGLLATLLSFKRSAMAFVGPILVMAVYYDFLKNRKNGIIKGLFITIIFLFSFFLIFNYIDNKTGGHITNRIELATVDGGSGRTDTYKAVWRNFKIKSWEYKLVGSGHNAVRNEAIMTLENTVSAHNDFLEVLYDYGIIGIGLYFLFIVKILQRTFSLRQVNAKYYHAHLAVLIIFIIMSMVSHLILYPTYFAYLVIIWAIVEGQMRRPANRNIDYEYIS